MLLQKIVLFITPSATQLVEIHKHGEFDGLNKTFFTGICFNLLLYVHICIYLEIIKDRYLFIVIYAY